MSLSETNSSGPTSRRLVGFSRIRFIVLLGLLDAFGPLGIDMYLPAFPQIERELHAASGMMQLTLSLFLAGLAVGQLICGPISDRLGRRGPLLFGSVAFAVSSVICAFTNSIEGLIAARFVMGLAGATGMVIARAVVRDCFEEKDSAKIYSMLMLVISIAPILSPSVGSWLMSLGSWTLIFWVLGIFGCLCGIAVYFDLPETHHPSNRRSDSFGTVMGQYVSMMFDRRFIGYAAPVSLALGELFAYVASAPSLFMDVFGLSANTFSLVFALNAVGLIGSAQFNRWLLDRFGTHSLMIATISMNAICVCTLCVLSWTGWGGAPAFMITTFLALSSLGIFLPNGAAAVMAPFPHQAGAASALLGMLQFAGGAITGAIVGIFADGTTWPMTITMLGCSLSAFVITILAEQLRRKETDLLPDDMFDTAITGEHRVQFLIASDPSLKTRTILDSESTD
ncbi:multidrug effflux MFS transporter [Planctomicrobium sp. SH661]|uniref:multidrug effflux MFS transporter n=1 Tax=Planctomicrobium sp. SH661 TaxID=3448124 RepID=UPI003F5C95C0